MFSSPCSIDVTSFPFDNQTCNLTFGSWTYLGHQLDLQLFGDGISFADYIPSGEWDILGMIFIVLFVCPMQFIAWDRI